MKSTPCSTRTLSSSTGLNGPPLSGTTQSGEVHRARDALRRGPPQLLGEHALEVWIDRDQSPLYGEPACARDG
jgi:hypothetical protein